MSAAEPLLPFAPLERVLAGGPGVSTKAIARAAHVDPKQVYRWRQDGISIRNADRLCIAADRHPAEVWPVEWSADVALEVAS